MIPAPAPSPSRNLRVLWGLSIFLAALGLRAIDLGQASFWQDEIAQLRRTTLSLREVWVHSPPDKPPLDYFIQAVLIGNRPNEWQARLHACLLGSAFVLVMSFWGWKAGGARLSVIVLLLTIASPVLVRYSQEGRPYSLMLLAEALFLATLLRPGHSGQRDRRGWILLTGVSVLCLWSHYSLLLPCLAAAVPGILTKRGSPRGAAHDGAGPPAEKPTSIAFFASCFLAFAVLVSPLLSRAQTAARGQIGWAVSEKTTTAFRWTEVSHYMDVLAWGYEPSTSVAFAGWGLAALMIVGWVGGIRGRNRIAAWSCALAFVAAFGGTIGLYYYFDRWIKVRYVLGALPPALFLAAMGVDQISAYFGRRIRGQRLAWIAWTLALAMAAPIGLLQAGYVLAYPVQRDDWRSVVERAARKGSDRTILLVADWHSIDVLGYYLELLGADLDFRGLYYDADRMEALIEEGHDVWVFGTHQDWWNIPREDISGFLTAFALLPQDLPGVWGIDVRRNRTPAELLEDRELTPLDELGENAFPLELPLEAESSPYLGGGWFFDQPWAAPYYRRQLMATVAEILLPLRRPNDMAISARLRQSGRQGGAGVSLSILLNDETLGNFTISGETSDFEWAVPASRLQAGLNVLRLEASEPLRIPPADSRDGASSASIEVEFLTVELK